MEIFSCCRIESVLQKLSSSDTYPEIGRWTLHEFFVETEVHRYTVVRKHPIVINFIFLHLFINYQFIQLIPYFYQHKVHKINIDGCFKNLSE